MMKFAVCLLVLVPLVFSAPVEPDYRNFFEDLLKPVAQGILHDLGSDDTLHACQTQCPTLLHTLVHLPANIQMYIDMGAGIVCPLACNEMMKLVHSLGHVTNAPGAPVGK